MTNFNLIKDNQTCIRCYKEVSNNICQSLYSRPPTKISEEVYFIVRVFKLSGILAVRLLMLAPLMCLR